MSLNESIVEDAALIMPGASLTQPLPLGEEQLLVAQTLTPASPTGRRRSARRSGVPQARARPFPRRRGVAFFDLCFIYPTDHGHDTTTD